nr:glucose-6-phosphate isomerase family protein [Pseudovibrio stylochi]
MVDPINGKLGNCGRTYQKKLRDLTQLYADSEAFEQAVQEQGDRIVYQVQDQHPEQQRGDLIFGVTYMQPGRIGDEYFLTRGHIHAIANRPEIYYGESGEGVMLMESPEGETRVIEIKPRVLCYVPPFWIHRSVNTGATPFVMSFTYPSDSGQDYGVIAQTFGMRSRIVADGTGWKEVPNASYQPRGAEQIKAIYATKG